MAKVKNLNLNGTTYDIGANEENLSWGGPNWAGSVSPIGMSLSSEHSANRMAFINGAAIAVEYSSDGGSTWTDYGYSASDKSAFWTLSKDIPIGRAASSTAYSTNSRTRMTITAQDGTNQYVYTDPKKMLLNISSSGGMNVLVEYRTGANYKSGGAWTTFGTYNLSGWSGWNDIPLILGTLGGGTSQTSNNWQLRLTFIMTSYSSSYPTTASVSAGRIYGSNSWSTPSTLANNGHLYSFDINKYAYFPANIYQNGTRVANSGVATGAGSAHNHSYTAPTGSGSFSGTAVTSGAGSAHSHIFTPSGSVTVNTTSGTTGAGSSHSHSFTPSGTISTGTGTANYTPAGSVTVNTTSGTTGAGSSHSHSYNAPKDHTHSVTPSKVCTISFSNGVLTITPATSGATSVDVAGTTAVTSGSGGGSTSATTGAESSHTHSYTKPNGGSFAGTGAQLVFSGTAGTTGSESSHTHSYTKPNGGSFSGTAGTTGSESSHTHSVTAKGSVTVGTTSSTTGSESSHTHTQN